MSRVFLEEADRPPPAYYQNNNLDEQKPLKIVPFQTPDPEKWISAPEFVPRSKQLADAFGFPTPDFDNQNPPESVPFDPNYYEYSLQNHFIPQAMPVPTPFNGIPPGYTANMTTINPGNGPPIAAILLRKKRKRRSKHSTNSMVNTHSTSPCSSHPSDPNGDISSCDEFQKNSDAENFSGSCPDLTTQQIQKWDDYLYETAKNVNENGILHESTGERTSEDLSSSVYECAAPGILETAAQTISGTSNKELQKLDQEINGNVMTSSMVLRKLANHHTYISDGCTEKTLEQEMNELTFRKPVVPQRYGYPQIDNNVSPYVHLATIDPKKKKIKNHLIDKDALKAYLDEEAEEEEDFLEGLNITVNNFDTCEDLSLSDVEQPSRFQQFQEAIRKNTVVIATDLQAPDRQCCTIM
ncbi:Protein CBG03425 [Caenorhabditis briggsae]|uniref:Uncharacterized protein n=2 Tax=Caenorhabditis briggsae TaxID=6238 RepID=A0AAE9D570_CAEBR|nr:Protein CBG03425 [Caenorhabditis briggsae]ULT95945.1 hypothetical protein L3Y34_004538 [Caenorhabditis briggsae]UMM29147.1 hypothetical protein L5515_011657 [Caenorhabditis briggsae]CAP24324.1 Protein CBG03425 [Caenorhabditis briggsae]